MKSIINTHLVDKSEIANNIYRFKIKSKELAQNSKPGQFVDIKCSEGLDVLLRRPISISGINRDDNIIEFIFEVKGKGTERLSRFEINQKLDVLGPLGNGFEVDSNYKNIAVLGGGIGIFPLLPLVKDINTDTKIFLGFRSKSNVMLENEFRNISQNLYISTDDGSYGQKGRITDVLIDNLQNGKVDIIYGCGPKPMLKELKNIAKSYNIPCQISLEERMGCGVGACLGCACKVKNDKEWIYKHICVDGPVFWSDEVIFDE